VTQAAFTVKQFENSYKVGHTKTCEEIKSGRLRSYKLGGRRYISASAAEEWQRRLEAETSDTKLNGVAVNAGNNDLRTDHGGARQYQSPATGERTMRRPPDGAVPSIATLACVCGVGIYDGRCATCRRYGEYASQIAARAMTPDDGPRPASTVSVDAIGGNARAVIGGNLPGHGQPTINCRLDDPAVA
jgi:hypothetical protein